MREGEREGERELGGREGRMSEEEREYLFSYLLAEEGLKADLTSENP